MKQRKGKAGSKKGNRYLTAITSETAVVADQAQTREGARYRRLSRRRGKAKAQVAFGNTQLKVCHALLSRPGTRFEGPGPHYGERQLANSIPGHRNWIPVPGRLCRLRPACPGWPAGRPAT